MSDPLHFPTRPAPTPQPGFAADLLPDTKLVVVTVALDLAWMWADGFDWHKLAMAALTLFAGWLIPSWRPPRSTADRVLADLRPGDQAGPRVATTGRRAFTVADPYADPS